MCGFLPCPLNLNSSSSPLSPFSSPFLPPPLSPTAELEAQYLEAEKRKQRLESLENKVKWYEERLKKEEDPLPLDVTKPNWSSPFPQPLEVSFFYFCFF